MDAVNDFFGWLFGTRPGVLTLMVGGIVLFLIIAFLLEKRTRAKFYNHKKGEDDWELFADDEDD